MNTEHKNIDQIDQIPDYDKGSKGYTMLKFIGIIILLIALAKLLDWLLK